MNALVPVTTMRFADPGQARQAVSLPEGMTIAEIIETLLPGLPEPVLGRLRVALVTPAGEQIIERHLWHRVRPFAGVHVVIRLVPGKEALRSLLTILVSIAASAIASFAAPFLISAGWSTFAVNVAKSVITLGVTALGGLLINALLPPDKPDKEKPVYAIGGWRNRFTPNQPFPDIMGKVRYAPPFAAMSWTEVVGDQLYSRALFTLGYGPVEISEQKLGESLLSSYDEVTTEIREGYPDDEPMTLFASQVIEVSQGVDLTRPRPRDEYGEIIAGASESKPVSRFTATDASGACIILSFPVGLLFINSKGKEGSFSVTLDIRFRIAGEEDWTDADPITITHKRREGFFRSHRIEFPTRGRYEIEIERMSEEEPPKGSDWTWLARCTWSVLQSFRPEYPLNFAKPLALVALRVKATAQLNGTLDNYNCVAEAIRPDYDEALDAWLPRKTVNPASYGRHALQGPGNPIPAPDEEIDLAAFEDWHDFCRLKGLTYNRVHDFDASLKQVLAAIGAAGRAVIRHDGRWWTVVIDRPREYPVAHINPRNSSGFRWSSSYFRTPDALRVQFLDETNNYQAAERLVPWPCDLKFATKAVLDADLSPEDGAEAEVHSDALDLNNGPWVKSGAPGAGSWAKKPIELTEQLDLPGKTHPDEIFIETRRRQHEIMHRATRYTAVQPGLLRTATPGDMVSASRDVLRLAMHSARVKAVRGNLIELDEVLTLSEGQSYAIRFLRIDEDESVSVVRLVTGGPGETNLLTLTGGGDVPRVRSIVHFGPAGEESYSVIVAAIERGKDDSSVIHMLPAAPEIDAKTDAEIPYPWSGRVGPIYPDITEPGVARIVAVLTGLTGTGDEDGLKVLLAPGLGSAAIVVSYELFHRASGAGTWEDPLTCAAAEASIDVPGYSAGDAVELQARAIGVGDVEGDLSTIITVTIGAGDDDVPEVLPVAAVAGDLGRANITFTTGPDLKTTEVQIYHNQTGVFDEEDALGAPISVVPNTSYVRVHGDPAVVNHYANGGFDTDTVWTKGGNWIIGSGVASKTPAAAAVISQTGTLSPGDTWRSAADVVVNAGAVMARLLGGTTVNGASVTASGLLLSSILVGGTGHTGMGYRGDASFDGTIDNARGFKQTPNSLPQGTHHFWLRPLNDGLPGPVSGPFTVIII
jgi:hypothetical protein